MKQYDVKISHAALSDMEQIYSYIADRLLEPDTAMGQYNRIAEAIQSLNILPERCALVESEPERTQGLRQMLVDNYSVFYIVGEDAVSVARVLYSASDLVRRLRLSLIHISCGWRSRCRTFWHSVPALGYRSC